MNVAQMLGRVSWGAVLAGLLTVLAIVAAVVEERTLAIVFGLCAIAWAVLSLKDRT